MFQRHSRQYFGLTLITFLGFFFILGSGLYNYFFANSSFIIEVQEHNAIVRFTANKASVLYLDECVEFAWQVEQISSVYFDGEGVSGNGNETICQRYPSEHVLLVNFQDGSQKEYRINIETAIPFALLISILAPLLIISGYFWACDLANAFPIPDHLPNPIGKEGLKFVPALDGFRAFALLMVFYAHFSWVEVQWGRIGVILFFVLSGFLIGSILFINRTRAEIEDVPKSSVLKGFYARRFLRIFPVYYLTLFVLYLLAYKPISQNIIWFTTYTFNIGAGFYGLRLGYANHFWSLAVEEQFYLFFPLLVLFLNRKYLKHTLALLIVIAIGYKTLGLYFGINWLGVAWSLIGNFDSLCLGALYALYLCNPKEYKDDARKLFMLCGIVGPYLLIFTQAWRIFWMELEHSEVPLFSGFSDFGTACLAILIIHSVLTLPKFPLKRLFELKWMQYIGRISYSAYVYHYFLMLTQIVPGRNILSFVVYTILTLLLASLSWYLFERPINSLKDRFPYLTKPSHEQSSSEQA